MLTAHVSAEHLAKQEHWDKHSCSGYFRTELSAQKSCFAVCLRAKRSLWHPASRSAPCMGPWDERKERELGEGEAEDVPAAIPSSSEGPWLTPCRYL